MASEVDICNMALGHLGDEANVSAINPSDGSAQADHCVVYYPMARDETLQRHAWSFATKRQALALLSTTEKPGNWLYAYQRPADCLQPIAVLAPVDTTTSGSLTSFPPTDPLNLRFKNNDDSENEYICETLADGTEVIYTNVETALLRYVRNITDTTKFTPLCRAAIARLLASKLAGPIIKGETGAKVAAAHLRQFETVDLPLATGTDSKAQRRNVYRDFVPDAINVRQ